MRRRRQPPGNSGRAADARRGHQRQSRRKILQWPRQILQSRHGPGKSGVGPPHFPRRWRAGVDPLARRWKVRPPRHYPEGIKSFSPVLEVAVRKDLHRVFVENRLVGRRCSAASLGGAAAPPYPSGLRNDPAGERAPLAAYPIPRGHQRGDPAAWRWKPAGLPPAASPHLPFP